MKNLREMTQVLLQVLAESKENQRILIVWCKKLREKDKTDICFQVLLKKTEIVLKFSSLRGKTCKISSCQQNETEKNSTELKMDFVLAHDFITKQQRSR